MSVVWEFDSHPPPILHGLPHCHRRLVYKKWDIVWLYMSRSTLIIDVISAVAFWVGTLASLLPEFNENSPTLSFIRVGLCI